MAEFIDPSDGTVYPRMEPEDFAAMPESFYEYTRQNPQVLPDYGVTAHAAFDLIQRRPDDLVVLEGSHGIGKTTRLIPELLKAGEKSGYKAHGSISVVGGTMGRQDVILDAWESVSRQNPLNTQVFFEAAGTKLYRFELARENMRLAETLRARFTDAEGQDGFFVFDEGVDAASSVPRLTQFVIDEAERSGATLAIVTPNREWDPLPLEKYQRLCQIASKPLVRRVIQEQLVSTQSVEGLLTAVGIEQGFADRFSRNDHLRRLRVFAYLAERLMYERQKAGDDDFIWDTEYVEDSSALSVFPSGYEARFAQTVFGLDQKQMEQADRDLRGAS